MLKVRWYFRQADECRTKAKTVSDPAEQCQFLALADTWDQLAESRLWLVEHGFARPAYDLMVA